MRPIRRITYAFSILLSLPGFAQSLPDVATRINDFGLRVFEHNARLDQGGNRVISPVANYLALSMATAGASNHTREILLRRLGYQPSADGVKFLNVGNELCQAALTAPESLENRDARAILANSAWTSTETFAGKVFELGSEYQSTLQESYDANTTRLDFRQPESAARINQWAERRTMGDIKEIVSADEVEDLMLLILNTTYFRGWWKHMFDVTYGKEAKTFHFADGRAVEREFIGARGDFAYARNAEEEFIEIPFRNGADQTYVFQAILPKAGTDLSKYRSGSAWSAARAVLNAAAPKDGFVSLPTFAFPYGFKMDEEADLTKALGLQEIFTDIADFSAMKTPQSPPAKVDFIKSVNRIALDQSGVTASAAAAVGLALAGSAPKAPDFILNLNRPFAFAITEKKSGLMVFVGEINDPGAPQAD